MATQFLIQLIQHHPCKYVGIDVDYEHINGTSFTLSSDKKTSNWLGYPRPTRHAATDYEHLVFHPKENEKRRAHIFAIRLSKWCPRGTIFINGLILDTITIECNFSATLMVSNCWIRKVVVRTNSTARRSMIHFGNTHVATLHLEPDCCDDMFMRDTWVQVISCPAPEDGNPFTGSLILTGDIQLAQKDMNTPLRRFFKGDVRMSGRIVQEQNIQSYRNLRRALSERGNTWASHVVRATELSLERKYYHSRLIKALNYLYDISSGFGNVPERATAILGALVGYNILLIWLNRLSVVAMDCASLSSSAWLAALCHGDEWSNFLASLLLALQGLLFALQGFLSPFGIFGAENAVTPSSVVLALWLWFSNVVIVVLLALIGVGIRRRMKE